MEQIAPTKAALLAAINQQWAALTAAVEQLSPAQLTAVRDAQGWSIKDHLVHLSAWERSAVFFLQGKPRADGLRVDPALYARNDFEAINAAIQAQTRDMPLDDVMAQLFAVHHELLDALRPLTDADLAKPYRAYLPNAAGLTDGRQAYQVIESNSSQHFAEHLGWIEGFLPQSGAEKHQA